MKEEESNEDREILQLLYLVKKHYSFYCTDEIEIYDIKAKLAEFEKDVYNDYNTLSLDNGKDYTNVIVGCTDYFSNKLEMRYKEKIVFKS
jgi:hypothetical protein